MNSGGNLTLFSRNRKTFNRRFAEVVDALVDLPDNTVIDGEVVALDDSGRPDFQLLQHFRSAAPRIHYFVFDLLVYNNRDLTTLPYTERRELMRSLLNPRSPRIRIPGSSFALLSQDKVVPLGDTC